MIVEIKAEVYKNDSYDCCSIGGDAALVVMQHWW